MTIIDAIVKVLTENTEGLTTKEIYEKILENKYYEFGAKDPIGVVAIQLKRFSEGQKISNPSQVRYFSVEQNGKEKIYKLKHCKGEVMGETRSFKHIKTTIGGIDIYTFPMSGLAGRYVWCGYCRNVCGSGYGNSNQGQHP